MELSEEHKKEIDNLIFNSNKDTSPDELFKQLMELSSKYDYKEDLTNISDKEIKGYNPETFEPIYK